MHNAIYINIQESGRGGRRRYIGVINGEKAHLVFADTNSQNDTPVDTPDARDVTITSFSDKIVPKTLRSSLQSRGPELGFEQKVLEFILRFWSQSFGLYKLL